jgi:ATP-dependent helicase HrpB
MYPILDLVPAIVEHLNKANTLIVQATPGAGKSTILPLQLLQQTFLNNKKIILLEPRRLAAKTVAQRMAQVQKQKVGEEIGYRVRFESKVSAQTRLEVITEAILNRMMQTDPFLEEVGMVMFDEFHERNMASDVALAMCLQLQQVMRPDLKLVIMSATLDAEKLKNVLGDVPVVTSEGKIFPVTTHYKPFPETELLPSAIMQTVKQALQQHEGDVLVFLPGQAEIQRSATLLEEANVPAKVLPLYGDLPFDKQEEAVLPDATGKRKIVLATSIAETSLTIEGIRVVIDSGWSRVSKFDARTSLSKLETIRVTQDAADQRRGRAARTGPGVCYRLWPQHLALVPQRKPEITEADLSSLVLELKHAGIHQPDALTWVTPPPKQAWYIAERLLHNLGALENDKITIKGKALLQLPTHPRLANMLIAFKDDKNAMQWKALACDVAAVLEERDFLAKESGVDLCLRLEILRKWRRGERVSAEISVLKRVEKLADQWRQIIKVNIDNDLFVHDHVGLLLARAFPERIALQENKHGSRYKLAGGQFATLPQHDDLIRESCLVIARLDAGNKEGRIFLAAPCSEKDLLNLAKDEERIFWDDERQMVAAQIEKRMGALVLASKPLHQLPSEKTAAVIIELIKEKGLRMLAWQEHVWQWIARVNSLHHWRKDETWPLLTETFLLQELDTWLLPFLTHVYKLSELQKLDAWLMLQNILPFEMQNKVNELAPAKIEVPTGSQITLQYFDDGSPPVLEVRLQEMFGLTETPVVNKGRTKIMLHLLSPGYKPVQVTQDLKSFWQNTYHEVRKELRMRYPKHHWPEDPWTAEAVRGAKRKQ